MSEECNLLFTTPMPYRICKMIEVENGHLLSKHPDKCRFPHGHTRKVELVFEADTLDEREMVFDFKLIGRMIGDFLETYDHALCMNTEDPKFAFFKEAYGDRIIGFDGEDPTTEVMARTIFEHAQSALQQHVHSQDSEYPVRPEVKINRIRVWETTSSWAEYYE